MLRGHVHVLSTAPPEDVGPLIRVVEDWVELRSEPLVLDILAENPIVELCRLAAVADRVRCRSTSLRPDPIKARILLSVLAKSAAAGRASLPPFPYGHTIPTSTPHCPCANKGTHRIPTTENKPKQFAEGGKFFFHFGANSARPNWPSRGARFAFLVGVPSPCGSGG